MFPISDSVASRKFPLVNLFLIAITGYAFYLQLINPESFTIRYALVPSQVSLADFNTLIPLVTSIFLHGGWLHILSNMWFLWVFGDNVEGALGHFWYLLLYITSGLVGGIAQYIFMPASNI